MEGSRTTRGNSASPATQMNATAATRPAVRATLRAIAERVERRQARVSVSVSFDKA